MRLIEAWRPDPKRWNLDRLRKNTTVEDTALAEQGLAEWAATLDQEDGQPGAVALVR
ncbi:MAG: hypothetical protein WD733_22535 [Bryobacterales bacterium]